MIKGVLTTNPNDPDGNRRRSHYSLIFGATALGVAAALFLLLTEGTNPAAEVDPELTGADQGAAASEPAEHGVETLLPARFAKAERAGLVRSNSGNTRQGQRASTVATAHDSGSDSRRVTAQVHSANDNSGPRKDDDLAMPEWKKIIYPDGSAVDVVGANGRGGTNGIPDYLELYPAFEAGYIEEVISNGVATDMSALLVERDVADEVLYNGAVSAAHDLGNAYYLLSSAANGNLRLYFGVERLRSDLPTFIEFELNQDRIHVGSGIPWWNIQGSRIEGDLLVRFNLIAGTLSSVELAEWRDNRYLIFESDTAGLGHGCRDRFSYLYCIGQPPLDRSHQYIEVWDEDFVPVEATLADSFVELGLDLGRLLRPGIEFSGLYIRTPEDVVLTSFQGIGLWAGNGIALR